jgi:hypothetical protein
MPDDSADLAQRRHLLGAALEGAGAAIHISAGCLSQIPSLQKLWFKLGRWIAHPDDFWLIEAQFARIKPHFPLLHGVPRVDDKSKNRFHDALKRPLVSFGSGRGERQRAPCSVPRRRE